MNYHELLFAAAIKKTASEARNADRMDLVHRGLQGPAPHMATARLDQEKSYEMYVKCAYDQILITAQIVGKLRRGDEVAEQDRGNAAIAKSISCVTSAS